jgi:biopolymer transport protein ExbD
MAELNQNEQPAKPGKARAKKLSTRMDMTPMVDLAFLLLTFFMLTTTFNKPFTMKITMPEKGDSTHVPLNTVTILVGANNQLVYYQGIFDAANQSIFHRSGYDKTLLRTDLMELNKKLIDKISEIEADFSKGLFNDSIYQQRINDVKKERDNEGVFVIIKAADDSKYENLVWLIDEMKICNMVNYSIVDITKEEEKIIASR